MNQRQSGAALVVSLVLLLVLTMLAISTMSTASLEMTMAGNEQYSENAFQLAETATSDYLATAGADPDCANTADPGICDIDENDDLLDEMGGTYSATSNFLDDYDGCPGGFSKGTFASYHFEIQAVGNTTARNASSQHTQGWLVCRNQ